LLAVALDEEGEKEAAKDNEDLDLDGDRIASTKKTTHPKTFLSFCKIGSGYSLKELYDFNQKLADKWKTFDKKNPPKHLQLAYEKPDAWIEPKDSFIVQVKAVEICNSDKYKTGASLRFPRLEAFRPDKNWFECMKLSELNELREKNDGKLASGKHFNLDDYDEEGNLINFEDGDEPVVKKKKMTGRGIKKVTLNDRYKGVDASNIKKVSSLFEGKEFCLVIDMGNETYDKKSLETNIVEFGGEIVQNPGENTYCIIAAKKIHKLNSYIKNDLYNIVKVEWLMKCIQSSEFIQWKPSDMIHTKSETKIYFNGLYDAVGDSYTEALTVESLKEIFNNIEPETKGNGSLRKSIAAFENKYFPDDSFKFGLFRLVSAYMDVYELPFGLKKRIKNSSLELIGLKIRWRGGECSECITDETTHCILDSKYNNLENFYVILF
jgi:DNA ligase-4